MMETFCYVLAIVLNMAPFSFLRYYPFRRSLRIPVPCLILLYCLVLCVEMAVYVYQYRVSGGDAFFDKESLIYDAFIIFYILFSFSIIRESVFKQLYLWFVLALYELAVFGMGVWMEECGQQAWGLPRFLLLDITVLVLLAATLPLWRRILRRLEPFLSLHRPEMWRWSWLPGAAFFFMNALYASENIRFLGDMAICRVLSWAASLMALYLLLYSFEFQHRRNVLQQRFMVTQAMRRQQQQAAMEDQARRQRTQETYDQLQFTLDQLRHYSGQEDEAAVQEIIAGEQAALLQQAPERHFCRQELLDGILSQMAESARLAGIRTEIRVKPDVLLDMDDMDVCVLFGNLLENAMQGCQTLPPNSRWLTLHISRAGSMTAITLDNSCRPDSIKSSEAEEDGGECVFYSAKRGYAEPGLGISSICDVAAKYGGGVEFKYEQGVFYASVLIG